ncbi:MAG: hypothetical protein NTZ74_05845 [Chloroflexi bacterium]|nr:hypothetical protein [Chloroflexota bacterium]
MKIKEYIILYIFSIFFFYFISLFIRVPGYMDSEYYFAQSLQISNGKGLVEPFIWNYLNDPSTIPTPSFLFWMPIASLLGSIGLSIVNSDSFYIARIPFIVLAGSIPVFSAYFAEEFLPNKKAGWLSGCLALFSGFYLPYLTITETFSPYMVLGGIFFLLVYKYSRDYVTNEKMYLYPLLLGVVIGAMTLTRSDGILWFVAGVITILTRKNKKLEEMELLRFRIASITIMFIGFIVLMFPWFMRNYLEFQTLFGPGNRHMLWLTKYEDLFIYPSKILSSSRMLMMGFQKFFYDRIGAFVTNIQSIISVSSGIILVPFILVGIWKKRGQKIVILTALMMIIIIFVMSFVFPYAGERGGFFHSASSVQILLWSVVPFGLDQVLKFFVIKRKWNLESSRKILSLTLILSMMIITLHLLRQKIIYGQENSISWNMTLEEFVVINQKIIEKTNDIDGIVMVNDPPGYYIATGRRAVAIPYGDLATILEVSKVFGVRYIALNREREDIKKYFNTEDITRYHIRLLAETGKYQVYAVD